MSEEQFSRAQLLYQQNRYKEAENVLGDILKSNPNDVNVLSLLSQIQLEQDKIPQAVELINSAVSLSPDNDYLYYIKAKIALYQEDYKEAEVYLDQAVSIDPHYAEYYALLAHVKLYRKQYSEALDLANQALEIDPENIVGLNTRSTALLKLGKKEEAFETIESALNEDPNNSFTHANFGWNLLEKGDHRQALVHFSESLKNDPTSEYAQSGMAEALKARYPFYKLFLKYNFWIGNLTAKYQWGVILGFYFGFRILKTITAKNEALQPFLVPVIVLLALVAYSTWIMTPISNLFLRLNAYGKHLLDNKEIKSANFVGLSSMIMLIGLILFMVFQDYKWLSIAIYGLTMMIPLSSMFTPAKIKNAMLIYTIVMALTGIAAVFNVLLTNEMDNVFAVFYMFEFIGFQYIANYLAIKNDNK